MNNIMKKLSPMTGRRDFADSQSGSKQTTENSTTDEESVKFHQDRALTLMHMRKLFSEFSKSHLSSAEYEQKIYRMLPLLAKVKVLSSWVGHIRYEAVHE